MERRTRASVIALAAVATITIGFGSVAVVAGIPANYGLTTTQALALVDPRPMSYTVGWIVFAAGVAASAMWRASWLARHAPTVRLTALRGSIWLIGAIGGMLFLPLLSWDLQLGYVAEPGVEPRGSSLVKFAIWWWLASPIALVVGVVWSSVSMYRTPMKPRMPLTPGTTSDAPSLTAPPLARRNLAQR